MSEYDKSQPYDVYEYNATTRPEAGQDFSAFPAHPSYPSDYVATHQTQMPSGLPQSAAATFNPISQNQQYSTHDPTYYGQQHVQYSGYVDPSPRQFPEVISWNPPQGPAGAKVTVHIRSIYDFDLPQVTPVIMFGQKRCQSVLNKMASQGQMFDYTLSADAPPRNSTDTPSPQVALSLTFDNSSLTWQPPSLEFGTFTYLDPPSYYPVETPKPEPRKRKLSPEASPRRSPTKKPSLQQLSGPHSAAPIATPASPFRRPSVQDAYSQSRRFSVGEVQPSYNTGLHRVQSQQFYGTAQTTTPLLQTSQSPSWSLPPHPQSATRSPSAAAMASVNRSSLLPTPASSNNPPLIRTSTLQQSPPTPGIGSSATTTFNPYAMYPANAKAMLKIDGDLNTMTDKWSSTEWEARRRLVQFRRSQSGSVITATFEPVTLEDRIPNSICVSCIWWEEKQECYVTSVDTISLLESLVAVRFTVEEKNRIRRNLEGFRPATVSKTKADSEDFFKLIMGFPNPKPRNIEKDVKVFPWRILATALKKIIGKYSASYSSTAGALHTPATAGPSYGGGGRGPDVDQRPGASPLSTSSSATSHGHAYASSMTAGYANHTGASAGLGIGPLAAPPPSATLAVPVTTTTGQTTAWHQPSAQYSTDLSATGRPSWDFGGAAYMNTSPATGLPTSAQSYSFSQRIPSLTGQPTMPVGARFVPLQNYEDQSQQTSHA